MKGTVKTTLRWVATIAVMPLVASYRVRSAMMGRDRALQGSTQFLALVPGLPGQYLRRAFLSFALEYCDPTATIEFGTIFSQAGTRIEAEVYIGPRCHLGLVHLERDVLIAAGVHIPSGGATHDFSDLTVPIRSQPHHRSIVRIGRGSWIASACIVMADVGRDTVVGAGSVVTRPLPAYVVAAGSPARVIRSRGDASASA
jgi:virginiamycin A acetyltransferase